MDEWVKWGFGIVAGLWLASLSWVANRQVQRLDQAAPKDQTDSRFNETIRRLDTHLSEDRAMHEKMMEKMEGIAIQIAKLEVKVGARQSNG